MLELILKSALGLEQIHELILEKSEIRRASIGSGLHFRSSGQPKSVPDLLPDSKTPMLPSLINPYLEKFLQKRKFNAAAGSRSMKQNLDTGVEVYDNKARKQFIDVVLSLWCCYVSLILFCLFDRSYRNYLSFGISLLLIAVLVMLTSAERFGDKVSSFIIIFQYFIHL